MMSNHLLLICLSITIINGLRWNNSGFSNWEAGKVIHIKNAKASPQVDVYSGEQITIVYDHRPYHDPIIVYCFITGYSATSEIVYSFCKETDCSITVKDGNTADNINMHNMILKLSASFPGTKGVKIEILLPEQLVDVSGNYHCQANDRKGNFMIRSNNIQIRDQMYWEYNLVLNGDRLRTGNTPSVRRELLPVTFPCMPGGLKYNLLKPDWIDQEFERPISWSICPVRKGYESLTAGEKATFSNCEKFTMIELDDPDKTLRPINMKKMKKWTFYVDDKGDLNIFQIDHEPSPPTMTYTLLCYRKVLIVATGLIAINTYFNQSSGDDIVSGVEFDATGADYTRVLKPISPLVQNINIYARSVDRLQDQSVHTVSIFAKYEASSSATAQWFYNGAVLNNGEFIKTNSFQVMFDNDITSEMAGNYSLLVTSGADKLTMMIIVSVLGTPKLKDPLCMPLIRYVWEFESTSFLCTYTDRPEELKLHINADEMAFDKPLSAAQTSLAQSYPYLNGLNFTILSTKSTSGDEATLNYAVYNMRKTQGQTIYQDHSVMFFVKNKYGLSVKSTSIYTVPKLKERVLVSPESNNCTVSCYSDVKHEFQCRIDVAQYDNKELIIDHYWTINGHRLEQLGNSDNQFAPYFTVDTITKDLVLHPIKSNLTSRDKFVKDALKSNYIECHFDLSSTTDAHPRFMYYSKDDVSLGNLLRARITIDYQPLNTAFIYWIVAVILALIILIILIVLLTRYCMRNKGETYPLDKIERKHGYDPEKEVQEEIFKPYERQEHDSEFMSDNTGDRKLSITGHSVGSADDGELDASDLDPSNFNEDGSMIGEYGANPRAGQR